MKLWLENSLNPFQGKERSSDIKSGDLVVVMIIRRWSDLEDMASCQVKPFVIPGDTNLRVKNSWKPLQSDFL